MNIYRVVKHKVAQLKSKKNKFVLCHRHDEDPKHLPNREEALDLVLYPGNEEGGRKAADLSKMPKN